MLRKSNATEGKNICNLLTKEYAIDEAQHLVFVKIYRGSLCNSVKNFATFRNQF
jgi:hypothetical protein